MRKVVFAALIGLAVTACQTDRQTAGTATGVAAVQSLAGLSGQLSAARLAPLPLHRAPDPRQGRATSPTGVAMS
jgi:hypothetical protein